MGRRSQPRQRRIPPRNNVERPILDFLDFSQRGEDQLRARINDERKRLAVQILIEDFAKRVGAEVDDSDLVDSAGVPPTTNDQRISLAAKALDATVCTYNVRDFEEATTPARVLRDDAFFERSFEVPASQTEGTILYVLRVHGDSTSIGGLLEFDDGTVVEGIDRRRLRIRYRVGEKERAETSKAQLPDGQPLGLVIRYERDSKIVVDAWHPSGRDAVPDEHWKVGSSGNMRLVSAPTSKTLRLTAFGRPSNCEFFGASTAPTALNDRQVSFGIGPESLDASYRSEGLDSLLDRGRLRDEPCRVCDIRSALVYDGAIVKPRSDLRTREHSPMQQAERTNRQLRKGAMLCSCS